MGNVIASIITGVITFSVLAALKVPAALVLALVSGVLNFIPIVGFIISSVLAAVLAATVSMNVLILVIAFYLVFNVVESYFITPKIFGYELEMSDSGGPDCRPCRCSARRRDGGAARAYRLPRSTHAIERLWLRDRLSPDTVEHMSAKRVIRSNLLPITAKQQYR